MSLGVSGWSARRVGLWGCGLVIGLIGTLFLPEPVLSRTLDQRRDMAIDLWLADAEIEGLRALAELAMQGDASSQLFLGLIDKDASLQGPAILGLSRTERLALLRAPGGLSGRNWVHDAAAAGNARAIAWQALWSLDADLGTAEQFVELQEHRAAAKTLLGLSKRRESGFAATVLGAPWYPDSLLYLSHDRVLSDDAATRLHPGDPQHRFGSGGSPQRDAMYDWLATSSVALPLRLACATECPQDTASCSHALYQAIGSYDVLVTHGSPVEALVSQERFVASARGTAALARRIMLMRSTRMRAAALEKLAKQSSCAADWLAVQFDAHTPSKIPKPE